MDATIHHGSAYGLAIAADSTAAVGLMPALEAHGCPRRHLAERRLRAEELKGTATCWSASLVFGTPGSIEKKSRSAGTGLLCSAPLTGEAMKALGQPHGYEDLAAASSYLDPTPISMGD